MGKRTASFFDLRVFDRNGCHCLNKSLQGCDIMNEQEKTRAYNKKISEIEHDIRLHHQFFQFNYGKRMFTQDYPIYYQKHEIYRSRKLRTGYEQKYTSLSLFKSSFLCYALLEVPEQCAKALRSYTLVTLFE